MIQIVVLPSWLTGVDFFFFLSWYPEANLCNADIRMLPLNFVLMGIGRFLIVSPSKKKGGGGEEQLAGSPFCILQNTILVSKMSFSVFWQEKQ